MPSTTTLRKALFHLLEGAPLVYVDCGARGARLPKWLRPIRETRYVGFEADAAECARLNAIAREHHLYVDAFLAGAAGERTFHVTANPACSSLLRPDTAMLSRFHELAPLFEVERKVRVGTQTLEGALGAHEIHTADFIELDTQGSELEILTGADRLLREGVLGVQVEVEFAPMYVDQPLFADVDVFLRARGFELFDLSRYRARRAAAGAEVPTRGQLLWGHALYLRDLRDVSPARCARYAVLAAMLDRPDLAVEALRRFRDATSGPDLLRAVATAESELTAVGETDATLAASVHCSTWSD